MFQILLYLLKYYILHQRLQDEIWFDDVDEEDIERSRGINAVASNASCEKSVDDLTLGGFTG